jgi:Extensin-like protein C-terminus
MSEHAFANALDISAFLTEDGRVIDVFGDWGPTRRDKQAAAESSKKMDRTQPTRLEQSNDLGPGATFLDEVHMEPAGCSARYSAPRPTRPIATTCTWIWPTAATAHFANRA